MSEFWRQRVIEQLERGESLEQIDRELGQIRNISDDERAALWLLAWGAQQLGNPGQAGSPQPRGPRDGRRPTGGPLGARERIR